MISGRVALGGLSVEFGNARRRFEERAEEVRRIADEHAGLLQEEREILQSLAELYLPELSPSAVGAGLAEMEDELRAALRSQEVHRKALFADLAVAEREVAEQQARAEALEPGEAAAADRVRRCREAAEEKLSADDEYQGWVADHEAAMERQEVLRKRRSRLASASSFERRRYDACLPYTRLRDRRWGTPDYRGRLIARVFDRWLARRIDYEELARRDVILTEGPRLTHAEVQEVRRRAAELERLTDEREAAVLAEVGLGNALPSWEEAKRGLEVERERLDRLRLRRDGLVGELQRVEAKQGQPWQEAIRRHRDFLQGETISGLARRAEQTPDPRDDDLVRRLGAVRDRIETSAEALEAAREELERLAGRTGFFADLKREATRRFVQRPARFSEEFRLEEALGANRDGAPRSDAVLGRLEEASVSDLHGPFAHVAGGLAEWVAAIESSLDHDLRIVEEVVDETFTDVLVFDAEGRVVSRRVTRRRAEP